MVDFGRIPGRAHLVGGVVSQPAGPSKLLRGDHVELAAITDADRERLFEWINDREEVLHNAGYTPVHESDHVDWFNSVRNRPDVVIFAIRMVSDGRLIGSCQLRDIDHRHATAELQIRIGTPDDRGRGYGTQAVRLLLLHAFRDLNLARVQLRVFATNARALRAYEKAGLTKEGVLRSAAYIDGARYDVVIMGILRDAASVE